MQKVTIENMLLAGHHSAAKPITVGGDGAAKVVLEVDASQLYKVIQILPSLGKVMNVTFEWGEEDAEYFA